MIINFENDVHEDDDQLMMTKENDKSILSNERIAAINWETTPG